MSLRARRAQHTSYANSLRQPASGNLHATTHRRRRLLFFFFLRQRTNSPSLSSPLPPSRSRPPKYTYGVSESAVSSRSGSGAKSQPTNDLVHIGVKSAALVSAVFVDFSRNIFNFLHKNKLDIVWRVQFLTGRRPTRSFAPGTVATIAL